MFPMWSMDRSSGGSTQRQFRLLLAQLGQLSLKLRDPALERPAKRERLQFSIERGGALLDRRVHHILIGDHHAANVPMLLGLTRRASHQLPRRGVIVPPTFLVAWIFRFVPVPLSSRIWKRAY